MRTAYEAVNESCRVFVAYGDSPAKTLKHMARLLKKSKVDWWSASTVNYSEEENVFYITIYV
jgi:hypothetical protein